MQHILEVCTANWASVVHAVEGGATRIELCSALSLDGLTPPTGFLATVRECYPDLKIHVLIRPREGNFVYDDAELRIIERDIHMALPFADAIVGGALTPDGHIDTLATQRMIRACQGKPFTFHRAFDVCRNPLSAFETLKSMGVARLLTSGQQPTALNGAPLIQDLVKRSEGRITVMPGGGVSPTNICHILKATGAVEIHGSFSLLSHNGQKETDADMVREAIANISCCESPQMMK